MQKFIWIPCVGRARPRIAVVHAAGNLLPGTYYTHVSGTILIVYCSGTAINRTCSQLSRHGAESQTAGFLYRFSC